MKNKKIGICISILILIVSAMGTIKADDTEMYTLIKPDWLTQIDNETIEISNNDILDDDYCFFMDSAYTGEPAKAGESFSVDGQSGTDSNAIVYCLYDDISQGQELVFHFIFNELYVIEERPVHKAYYTAPTINVFVNGEWREGITLGGAFINTDVTLPKTYVGCYGYGLCFDEDRIIPFEIVCKVYVQNDSNPNRFDLDNEDESGGLWIYDIAPRPINMPEPIQHTELMLTEQEGLTC